MKKTANALVSELGALVTLPGVYLHITRLLSDSRSSAADIAQAVSQDPAFTVRLLRIANSALYGFPSAVDTVAKAVAIIGTTQVNHLALSLSVIDRFEALPNELVAMEHFWRHSLFCALIARHLAARVGGGDGDAVFTGGLLHDIGELVIFNRLPREAKRALLMVESSENRLAVHEAERLVLAFDHGAVGGELARRWNLPPLLEECIACHHDVAKATHHPRAAALVHLANIFSRMAELDTLDPGDVPPVDPLAWQLTGLGEDCVEAAVGAGQAGIEEAMRLFVGEK